MHENRLEKFSCGQVFLLLKNFHHEERICGLYNDGDYP